MPLHAFVDESRRGSYLLAVALLSSVELQPARTLLRGLCLPGERRVHFQFERDTRRRTVIARLVAAGVRVRIYEADGPAAAARAAGLTRLVEDLMKLDARRLATRAGARSRTAPTAG